MIKAGIPPFHFWFPQVIKLSFWTQCFIILTWQKIAPFIILSFIFNRSVFFYIIVRCLIGVLGGFNQRSIKTILTYSSIIHSAWIISLIITNINGWIKYFFIYSLISFRIIFIIKNNQVNNIKKTIVINRRIKFKWILYINIFSLGGLPPFLGFLAKFIAARILISIEFRWIILGLLILSSLIALFFYCKIIYISLLINSLRLNYLKKK